MDFIVNTSTLNIRLTPDTSQPAIASFSEGMKVVTTDEEFSDGRLIWRKIVDPHIFADHFVAERTIDRRTIFMRPLARVGIQQVGNRWFFTIDGELHRSIGVNVREFPWFGIRKHTIANNETRYFDKMDDIKARIVRFYAPLIDQDEDKIVERTRHILDLLDDRNMLGIVVLNDALNHSSSWLREEDEWHKGGGEGVLTREYYVPENYTTPYLKLVKRMAQEFQNHPAIFAWDLLNEPSLFFRRKLENNVLSGEIAANVRDADRQNFFKFIEDAVGAIREFDKAHLISIGLINSRQLGASAEPRQFATKIFEELNGLLDFVQVHFYQKSPESDTPWDEEARSQDDAFAAIANKMPIVVGEFGSSSVGANRIEATQNMLNRWLNVHQAALMLQWGFMADERDTNVGDAEHGFDPILGEANGSTNKFVFEGLCDLYRDTNTALENVV